MGDIDEGVVLRFAQKLAVNEPKYRGRAVRKLKKWMQVRSASTNGGFSEGDFLKIWKGLHYCMWMADKPLYQENLAEEISSIIHCFKQPEVAFRFASAFFKTEAREWFGIDRLRLDKFMMLVRKMLRHSLQLIKDHGWCKEHIKVFSDILYTSILNGTNSRIPDGLKFHLNDIYLDELKEVGNGELSPKQVCSMMKPFCHLIGETLSKTVAANVNKKIFEPLVLAGSRLRNLDDNDDDDEEETEDAELMDGLEIKKKPLKSRTLLVDFKQLADQLFALASQKNVNNRKLIYKIVTVLNDASQGRFPEDEEFSDFEEYNSSALEQDAVSRLMQFHKATENIKRKRKRKRRESDDSIDMEDGEDDQPMEDDEDDGDAGAPRRRKLQNHVADGDDGVDSVQQGKKKKLKHLKKLKVQTVDTDEENCTAFQDKDISARGSATKRKKLQNPVKDNDDEEVNVRQCENFFLQKSKKHRLQTGGVNAIKCNGDNTTVKTVKPKCNTDFVEAVTTPSLVKYGEGDGCNNKSTITKQRQQNIQLQTAVTAEQLKTLKNTIKKLKPTEETDSFVGGFVDDDSDHEAIAKPKLKNKERKVGNVLQTSLSKSVEKKGKDENDDDELVDGEIEIWVPNKRFKGAAVAPTPKQSPSPSGGKSISINSNGAPFAKFDVVKTPPAAGYVKRMKSPKTEPKQQITKALVACPGSAPEKKVKFVMSKNQSQEFEDSLRPTPKQAFNPRLKPDQGILKPSPTPPTNSQLKMKKLFNITKNVKCKTGQLF